MPVTVIAGSIRVIFPELVRVQGQDRDLVKATPIHQLALSEPPAEIFPGVHVGEEPHFGFELAAVHGAEELARIEAVWAVVDVAALVLGLCAVFGQQPRVNGNGQREETANFGMGLEIPKRPRSVAARRGSLGG